MKNRNIVLMVPVIYDKEYINNFCNNQLLDEAINIKGNTDKDVISNLSEISELPDILKNTNFVDDFSRLKNGNTKEMAREILNEEEIWFEKCFNDAIKNNCSFISNFTKKFIKKGKISITNNDLFIPVNEMPNYYVYITYNESIDYAICEYYIDCYSDEIFDKCMYNELLIRNCPIKEFVDGRAIPLYNSLLEYKLKICGEPKLIINCDMKNTVMDKAKVKEILRQGAANWYSHYIIGDENDISEYKMKDIRDYDVYISQYAIIIESKIETEYNFTDTILYLDDYDSLRIIKQFEYLALFFYEICMLKKSILENLNQKISNRISANSESDNSYDFDKDSLSIQSYYGKAISLWNGHAKDPIDQSVYTKIENVLQVVLLKNEFNELYSQLKNIKDTSSQIKDKSLANKLNVIQMISIFAILAGWILEIIKNLYIPNRSIMYMSISVLLFGIICILGVLTYNLFKNK